jgi:S1-C subfamily serine protease
MDKPSRTSNINKLLKTLVRIHGYGRPVDYTKPFVEQERKEAVGSGTFVDPSALRLSPTSGDVLYILTCAHVVEQADQVSVVLPLRGSEKLPATVLALVPRQDYDLALLALPNPNGVHNRFVSTLPLGASTALQPGDKLVALGFPMGQTGLKVSDGVFAGLEHFLQHTVSISPGNSGGPLINNRGQLIGINNAGIVHVAASNIGYAVPIELYVITASRFFQKQLGPPTPDRVLRQPLYGLKVQPTTQAHLKRIAGSLADSKTGVYVYDVVSESPAAQGGVQVGDFLGAVESVPIDFQGELQVSWSAQKVPLQTVLQRLSNPNKTYSFIIFSHQQQEWKTVRLSPVILDLGAATCFYSPYDNIPYMDLKGFTVMPLMQNHKYTPLQKAFTELTPEEKLQSHVIITYVVPGSPADLSKTLKAGDRLTFVNKQPVSTLTDVQRALQLGQDQDIYLTTSKNKSTVI